ncbi:MAG: segregation/condensation protein A [Thermoguttaceae bacterium]|nr:segregation/condensation protein A [Thermoguttaceae bacterium]MDW8079863.1 ScpA family protein [Thermoguttaceae bacterium]
MGFQARLGIFEGPLDILLLLVRRGEIDPREISAAQVVEQFLAYLAQDQRDFLGEAAEFLALVSLLLELKSQQLLPHPEESLVEAECQQEERLVERLLAYEQYRRAAIALEERARRWRDCFPRMVSEPEPEALSPFSTELPSVWDLFTAFQRVLEEAEAARPANIVYDDTPIQVYMERILAKVAERGRASFRELFASGMNRATLVSMLLALLELVAEGKLVVEQRELFGEIWLVQPPQSQSRPGEAGKPQEATHHPLAR